VGGGTGEGPTPRSGERGGRAGGVGQGGESGEKIGARRVNSRWFAVVTVHTFCD